MKANALKTITLAFLVLCVPGCDLLDLLNPEEPYRDLDDDKTTSIVVTIPRIEASPSKSTNMTVYVSVTDQDDNALPNFNALNFKIYYLCVGSQDTTEVKKHSLAELGSTRSYAAAALTMDYSGSMSRSDIQNMEAAVKEFINLKHPSEYLQIIKFASSVAVMNEFSSNQTVLNDAVDEGASIGWATAYFDAVDIGLDNTNDFVEQNASLLPIVVAFTDGYENNSRATLPEIINKALDYQIPVYTVGFGSVDESTMVYMANETGGRYFYTPDAEEIEDLYNMISGQLQNIYSLAWNLGSTGCNEILIVVKAEYETANGLLTATASRAFNLR